jgi:RNA polymerase sigma-70 factor (ECF subfamily)
VPPAASDESAIEALCRAGAYGEAVTGALRRYGTELLSFLRVVARDDDLAAEAFAELGEDLWRGLPRFRWDASLRTWLYALARNALGQLRRDPRRRSERNLPLSAADDLAAITRTATLEIQRTDVKDGFRVLREQLDPEEHELLLLRLDRGLAWRDIARILGGDDQLTVRAAALRKRFERAKQRLKKLAIEHGLIQRD